MSSWRTTTPAAGPLDRARLSSLGQLRLYPLRDLRGRHHQELEPAGLAAVLGDEDDELAGAQLEAWLERVLREPHDERRGEQLAQRDVVLVVVGPELVALVERRRLELDLLDARPLQPVGVAVQALEDTTSPAQIDPLEARHAQLADVHGCQREVVRLPGVGLVAVVLAAFERVPADAAAMRLHPMLAMATVAARKQRRERIQRVLLPVVQLVRGGEAREELVLG